MTVEDRGIEPHSIAPTSQCIIEILKNILDVMLRIKKLPQFLVKPKSSIEMYLQVQNCAKLY